MKIYNLKIQERNEQERLILNKIKRSENRILFLLNIGDELEIENKDKITYIFGVIEDREMVDCTGRGEEKLCYQSLDDYNETEIYDFQEITNETMYSDPILIEMLTIDIDYTLEQINDYNEAKIDYLKRFIK